MYFIRCFYFVLYFTFSMFVYLPQIINRFNLKTCNKTRNLEFKIPDFYHFNPTCEYAIANGTDSWQPNKLLTKMESDLETLPLFYATSKDYLIVSRKPSKQFIETLERLNIEIPMFIFRNEILNHDFFSIKKGDLKPWGWSPAEHKFLAPLKETCSESFKNSPVFSWLPEHKNIYSRKFAASILKTMLDDFTNEVFIPKQQLTTACTTQSEIENLVQRWGQLMIKAPWSSSGRGLQTIRKTPVHPKVWAKIFSFINEQGYVTVEPYLNKVLDVAFQFEMIKGKVNFLGISNFSTDYKGQYNGNSLNGLPDSLDKTLIDFVHLLPEKIIPSIITILERSDLSRYYEGIFGVDTLVYSDKNNQLKVNPCLEINVRHNMGLLSIRLEKLIHSEKKGIFRTYYNPGTSFYNFTKEMKTKHPLKLKDHKIESGFFPLTESTEDKLFGAYLLV